MAALNGPDNATDRYRVQPFSPAIWLAGRKRRSGRSLQFASHQRRQSMNVMLLPHNGLMCGIIGHFNDPAEGGVATYLSAANRLVAATRR
jgi:hypothetical protein